MLVPRRLRLLTLEGSRHLSAASGIVRVGDTAWVVADDEHHLGRLHSGGLELVRFLPGDLPLDSGQRKKRKPDVEVLMHVPGERDLLVLFGSGARPQRECVFTMALHPDGTAAAGAVQVPAASFYAPLRDLFAEPNIEAGCIDGAMAHLFQRANRGQGDNARITYDTAQLSAWLRGSAQPPRPVSVHRFSLGVHNGVPFGITDAAAWSRPGFLFTAVAEDTADAYSDGACVASMVGWMDAEGQVRAHELLAGSPKVEGITPAGDGRLWLVTDADDPHRPSELLEVQWNP